MGLTAGSLSQESPACFFACLCITCHPILERFPLPSPVSAGNEMRELWQEYEDAQTDEAKLVKDFDKVA